MAMLSPVAGLRPWRAARLRVANVPKPAIETFSPRARASTMVANIAATTLSTSALVTGGPRGHARRQFALVHCSSPCRGDRTSPPDAAADQGAVSPDSAQRRCGMRRRRTGPAWSRRRGIDWSVVVLTEQSRLGDFGDGVARECRQRASRRGCGRVMRKSGQLDRRSVNGGGNMYRGGGAKMYHGLGGSLSA